MKKILMLAMVVVSMFSLNTFAATFPTWGNTPNFTPTTVTLQLNAIPYTPGTPTGNVYIQNKLGKPICAVLGATVNGVATTFCFILDTPESWSMYSTLTEARKNLKPVSLFFASTNNSGLVTNSMLATIEYRVISGSNWVYPVALGVGQ